MRVDPWVRKIPWRRKWQPSLVFLPGESHGQRSLAGCSPWGLQKSQTQLNRPSSRIYSERQLLHPKKVGLGE